MKSKEPTNKSGANPEFRIEIRSPQKNYSANSEFEIRTDQQKSGKLRHRTYICIYLHIRYDKGNAYMYVHVLFPACSSP